MKVYRCDPCDIEIMVHQHYDGPLVTCPKCFTLMEEEKMVNMIRKPKKTKRSTTPELSYDQQERYPYGLQVSLESEELKKLGLDVKDYEVQEKIKLVCRAEVTGLHSNKNEPNEDRQSMHIQITDIEISNLAGLSLKQLKALNE